MGRKVRLKRWEYGPFSLGHMNYGPKLRICQNSLYKSIEKKNWTGEMGVGSHESTVQNLGHA